MAKEDKAKIFILREKEKILKKKRKIHRKRKYIILYHQKNMKIQYKIDILKQKLS